MLSPEMIEEDVATFRPLHIIYTLKRVPTFQNMRI